MMMLLRTIATAYSPCLLQEMMTITLGFPNSMQGKTIGLTGPYDGDQSNDFTYLNGSTQISANSTESEIFEWASSCEYCTILNPWSVYY